LPRGATAAMLEPMLEVHNTLTRTRERVAGPGGGRVRMYSCGPTVYRFAHIGNLRTFLLGDLVRRVLALRRIEARQVQNITDVGHMTDEQFDRGEDRMLVSAKLESRSPQEIAAWYTQAFFADSAAVGILPAHAYPRASAYVPQMIELVERLLARGHAYESGSTVYFSVESFAHYGRLSGNSPERLAPGHRVEVDAAKRHHADFVLWRAAGPRRVVTWPSPWGEGFPGWHVECSAMLLAELGEDVDLHTGGADLVFPHHEDEIAQSEGAVGHQVVRTWLHGAHLLAEGRKMSKSAGNFYDLRDLDARGIEPLALRLLFLQTRYQRQFDFTWAGLEGAATALARLRRRVAEWSRAPAGDEPAAAEFEKRFVAALEDDLDTPRALAVMAELEADQRLSPATRAAVLLGWDRVLGLDLGRDTAQTLPEGADALIARRAEARAARDFAAADTLREQLAAMGVEVTDTAAGTTWRRRG
jgi:cysteinyl-tRNA synthetase